MQIYLVGGAVRDTLLGLPVTDRDWVVVGATPQQLIDRGFIPVGRDFPVFLHPQTREQYALARTERKTAPGYRGFAVHAAPDVTLEQDLERRDLTINAMAVAEEYVDDRGLFDPARTILTDPHQGAAALRCKSLRHVSPAFREDPVRILRVARFAARFPDFQVAAETMELMREMVRRGETDALVAERVWQELSKGLGEAAPLRMFDVLRRAGALQVLLPELGIAASDNSSASEVTRPMAVVAQAARVGASLPVRFACLCLRLETAASRSASSDSPIATLCGRLRVPLEYRELAETAARERVAVAGCRDLDAHALVRLLERCDAFRKPARFAELLLVCECDAAADSLAAQTLFPQRDYLGAALAAAQAVATDTVAAQAQAEGAVGQQVGEKIRQARAAAVLPLLRR